MGLERSCEELRFGSGTRCEILLEVVQQEAGESSLVICVGTGLTDLICVALGAARHWLA